MEELSNDALNLAPNSVMSTQLEKTPCLYCRLLFQPQRRWIKKYCCESCRTLACRKRKNGVSGTMHDRVKSVSVTDLYRIQEQLIAEMKDARQVTNLWMQEVMRVVHEIKLDQKPESIKELERIIYEWQRNGMSKVPEQVSEMRMGRLKQELQTSQILKTQNVQMLLTVLSSLFGPILGQEIWNGVKGVVAKKKVVPIEEKIDNIMSIVNKLVVSK